jgi:hypothetical protein
MQQHVASLLGLAIVALFFSGLPLTADTRCSGVLTGEHDNVIVPEGSSCVIADADVSGDVKVESFGALDIVGATRIEGNVQSDGARYVRVLGASVWIGGDLQIKKSLEGSGYQAGTRIRGNVQYEENQGSVRADGGVVRGNVQIIKNFGGGSVFGNTIRQTLQCKENFPAIAGGGNRAEKKEDQCAGM